MESLFWGTVSLTVESFDSQTPSGLGDPSGCELPLAPGFFSVIDPFWFWASLRGLIPCGPSLWLKGLVLHGFFLLACLARILPKRGPQGPSDVGLLMYFECGLRLS
ncbi:UNVERIFIED_CONTAM: hypothetical protein Slati_3003900 [Sesamum latifolium]|uniref:Uncharacterized protein n=1 Tax=Sesamum latifolium TaxID=2727402 RepID=A0AAW2VKK8_9LAMI